MRNSVLASATALLLAAGAAWADKVVLLTSDGKSEMTRDKVSVLDFKNGEIKFRQVSGGSETTKNLKDVPLINLDEQPAFNDAEVKAKAGKYAEAMEQYDLAARDAKDWQAALVAYRSLRVAKLAKKTDKAVTIWLKLADQSGGDKNVLTFRPDANSFGAKGSAANKSAITTLESKRTELKGKADRVDYRGAVLQLLMELYTAEDNATKIAEIAGDITGAANTASGNTGGSTGNTGGAVSVVANVGSGGAAGSDSAVASKLGAYKKLMDMGQISKKDMESIVSSFQSDRDTYRNDDLALALLVAGRAQFMLYQQADDKSESKPLVDAGLNLMRVFAFFPESDLSAEALFYAGQVNEELGNPKGAKSAYERIVRGYAKSGYAAKAADAIKALNKSK